METTTLQTICEDIRLSLVETKDTLLAEMRSYPQPVSGCDQQYYYLIEKRDQIYRELTLLESITSPDKDIADVIRLVDKLLQSSKFIDAGQLQQIRVEREATFA